jgi:Fe-S-cluster containining protein
MEPVCARCPKALGHSCCEVGEGDGLATLTLSDVERISAWARLRAEAFSEDHWLSDEEALAYEARRPLYEGYFRHGPRRLTLRRARGACVFLDRASGCRLPAQVRPIACRLFPFEDPSGLTVERHGSVESARESGAGCLAVEESPDATALLRAFSLTPAALDDLLSIQRVAVKDHARRTSPAGSQR